jgi:hypothetical protein
MTSLQLARKARELVGLVHKPARLYRTIIRYVWNMDVFRRYVSLLRSWHHHQIGVTFWLSKQGYRSLLSPLVEASCKYV